MGLIAKEKDESEIWVDCRHGMYPSYYLLEDNTGIELYYDADHPNDRRIVSYTWEELEN